MMGKPTGTGYACFLPLEGEGGAPSLGSAMGSVHGTFDGGAK